MNILLTSVGRRSYMVNYFKDALKGIGMVHAANSVKTYAMQLADKSIITPLIYDKSYIEFVYNYSIKNKINAIISLFDIDIAVLAGNKELFENTGIKVLVSRYELISICNDKWLTYRYLKENNFNTPFTFLSLNDTFEAIRKNEIQYPLIIKPRWGSGSIGIFEADNDAELEIFYKKTKKCISDSYLKYESESEPTQNVIIQEKLKSEEFGLDIFNDFNGNILTCIPKKKLEMRAGETDSAEIMNLPTLIDLGTKLSAKTKHIGNLDVDCFIIENKIYILEMNCRFGGQYPFSHIAGVNFPKAIVKMLLGEKPDNKLLQAKAGTISIKDILPVLLK